MRRACRLAQQVLSTLVSAAKIGVSTQDLDALAFDLITKASAYPSPLNYYGFPKSICTSVNEVICHGIPDSRPLADGDILNLDVTVFLDGFHGDCSQTVLIGNVPAPIRKLVSCAEECLWAGIRTVKPGSKVRDIGRAIQDIADRAGYGVVRDFVGHGIGRKFHLDPQMPHYYEPRATQELIPGMAFTIEPMINQGTWKRTLWPDGWTAVTADLKPSAQFEHTLLVTESGVEILTLAEGEVPPIPWRE
jgi:methionyl aminopeptidase